MVRSPRLMLISAGAFAVAAAAVWLVAFRTAMGVRWDATIVTGFTELRGPRVDRLSEAVAHLADPVPFGLAAGAIIMVGLVRRRPWLAGMTLGVLVSVSVTTQALKMVTAEPRLASAMTGGHVAAASWPSGHVTAAMTMALCAVVVVPARWRSLAIAAGAPFTIGVAYSVLVLGWHLPSDVLGGFCVATAWTLVGVAAVTALERRRAPWRPLQSRARSRRPPQPASRRWR
jgi:membrane-associated phospholipid phosphatase